MKNQWLKQTKFTHKWLNPTRAMLVTQQTRFFYTEYIFKAHVVEPSLLEWKLELITSVKHIRYERILTI
jgi:hypothetical protein